MNRIGMRGVAVLLVLSVSGCATPGYSPVSRTADWLPPGANVAMVAGRFNPTLALDAAVRGRGEGGATGVLEGMGACAQIATNELGALFAIVCMPFGAAFGAIAGAIRAAPEENVATAEQRIASASKSVDPHRLLLESVQRYARESGLSGLAALPDEGPQSPEDAPRYRGGPDYVVEVVLTELRATTPGSAALPYYFRLSARGRLVRVADNEVVDTFTSTAATSAATVDEWTAENGKLFVEELGDALQRVGVAFVDEWILLYRGETAAGTGTKLNRTPDYMLRSLWPVQISIRLIKRPKIAGHLYPINVGTVTPLLAWEKLPSTVRVELFEGASPRARNIRYDVQVFDAGPFLRVPGLIAARRVVRRYTDLKAPEVRVEETLTPCTYYFWTVRARFELDGRQRSTEWSGAYHTIGGDADPRWDRRSSWPALNSRLPNRAFYFPFMTSTADGKACG
jgi:hypothetical protein